MAGTERAAPGSAPARVLPEGALPLDNTVITVRPGGVNVRAAPEKNSDKLGSLDGGEKRRVDTLVFGDFSWLRTDWPRGGEDNHAWIAGEFTDFARSRAYNPVAAAWYESGAVLDFRRGLMKDLLKARGAEADKIAQVDQLAGENLRKLEDTLTRQTVPAGYVKLWQLQERLGLPAPFEFLPVHTSPPSVTFDFSGFGPNTFAFENWSLYYEKTRGFHNGVDYLVPEGSPLIAVADGVIVDFRFLGNEMEQSLTLRPYLPEQYRKPDGSRVLSNIIVAYGHLTGDPTSELVRVGSTVSAGQIIGTSGWPVYTRDDGSLGVQHNNAHLHLEIHLVTDGQRKFGSRQPLNPLLFWSPRWIAFQARLATRDDPSPYPSSGQPWGKLGFFSVGCFRYEPPSIVWGFEPQRGAVWPEGVYDLDNMVKWLAAFAPYPVDGSGAF